MVFNYGPASTTINGEALKVTLTDYQIGRMQYGCTSVPYKQNTVDMLMAHTLRKFFQNLPGDDFTVVRQVGNVVGEAIPKRLNRDMVRVLIFKQSGDIPNVEEMAAVDFDENVVGDQFVALPPPVNLYVTCVYDMYNVVFGNINGDCVYVTREQIKPTPPS